MQFDWQDLSENGVHGIENKEILRVELFFSPNESGSGMLGEEPEHMLIVQKKKKEIFSILEEILFWDLGALLSALQHDAWWCP